MASRSSSPPDPLTPELVSALRAKLEEGERLAWVASPEPVACERKPEVGKWDGFVILGLGYSTIGAIVSVIVTGQWAWLLLPASLVVLGLLVFLVSRAIRARERRVLAGTVYGLTTRRALILHTYPSEKLDAVSIDAIEDVSLIEPRGPFADLGFGPSGGALLLVWRGIPDPERTRTKLLRAIRDPVATEQELAASEAYLAAMRQLVARTQG